MASSTPPDQSASVSPVVEAKQRVHSLLVSQNNETEPNLRPKSRAKVCRRLETLAALVPNRSGGKGFDAETLGGEAEAVGFEAVVEFEWCLGQAVEMHGTSMEAAALVDDHLHTLLPVSAHRFKYLILRGSKR